LTVNPYKETERLWREKKKLEDPDYFKRERERWRAKKLSQDPEYFKKKYREYRLTHDKEMREKQYQYYHAHRERILEMRRRWLVNHPGFSTQSKLRTIHRDPERHRARTIAGRYAKIGSKCDKCGTTENLEMHHEDYSKILEVNTLCKQCHEARHLELKQAGIEIPRPSLEELKNRHCDNCSKTWPHCGRNRVSVQGRPCSLWEGGTKAKSKIQFEINNCVNCGKSIPETCNRQRIQHKCPCLDWIPKASLVQTNNKEAKQ
jgi:hypothetical protein